MSYKSFKAIEIEIINENKKPLNIDNVDVGDKAKQFLLFIENKKSVYSKEYINILKIDKSQIGRHIKRLIDNNILATERDEKSQQFTKFIILDASKWTLKKRRINRYK